MAKSREKEEDPKRPTPVTRDGAYVMMLFISLVAMIAGCIFLNQDWEDYGKQNPPKETEVKIKQLGTEAKLPDPNPPNTGPKPPDAPPGMGMPPMGMMGGPPPMP